MTLPLRARVEHAANPALERLNRLPRLVPFLVVLALLVVGILVPRWGFLATAVVALVVTFLTYYTWPRLVPSEKLLRVAVLALVTAVMLAQAFPKR